MTCRAYTTVFHKYMEGILDREGLEDLQQHIAACSACRGAFKEFSQMDKMLRDSVNPSDPCKQKVSQAIANLEIQPQRQVPSRTALASFLRYGAAAAVFLVVGVYVGSRRTPDFTPQQKPLSITVSQLRGDVLVKHAWEDIWRSVTPEASIYEGDKFMSLHEASLVLSLGQSNTVSLDESSSLNVLEHNGQTEFGITYGTVKAKLDGPHGPFFISTPHGRVEALGTEFTVKVTDE